MMQPAFEFFDTKFSPKPGTLEKGKIRVLGRCRHKGCEVCKAFDVPTRTRKLCGMTSVLPDMTGISPNSNVCPTHKVELTFSAVEGTFSDKHECDPRCMSAKGPICVCNCGGANHGSGWL